MPAHLDPTSKTQRCLAALQDGPGTSDELAAELGLPVKNVSTFLNDLARAGKVVRQPFNGAPRAYWLWALPEHVEVRHAAAA